MILEKRTYEREKNEPKNSLKRHIMIHFSNLKSYRLIFLSKFQILIIDCFLFSVKMQHVDITKKIIFLSNLKFS